MKNELYKAIKSHCEDNQCWGVRYTAKEWNEMLDTSYSAATFTSLVSNGHLTREKRYGEKSYSYGLADTDEMREARAKAKREREIEYAKYTVEHYDENTARARARYEEAIRRAEEQLKQDLEWEAERLAKAKALLEE